MHSDPLMSYAMLAFDVIVDMRIQLFPIVLFAVITLNLFFDSNGVTDEFLVRVSLFSLGVPIEISIKFHRKQLSRDFKH